MGSRGICSDNHGPSPPDWRRGGLNWVETLRDSQGRAENPSADAQARNNTSSRRIIWDLQQTLLISFCHRGCRAAWTGEPGSLSRCTQVLRESANATDTNSTLDQVIESGWRDL